MQAPLPQKHLLIPPEIGQQHDDPGAVQIALWAIFRADRGFQQDTFHLQRLDSLVLILFLSRVGVVGKEISYLSTHKPVGKCAGTTIIPANKIRTMIRESREIGDFGLSIIDLQMP